MGSQRSGETISLITDVVGDLVHTPIKEGGEKLTMDLVLDICKEGADIRNHTHKIIPLLPQRLLRSGKCRLGESLGDSSELVKDEGPSRDLLLDPFRLHHLVSNVGSKISGAGCDLEVETAQSFTGTVEVGLRRDKDALTGLREVSVPRPKLAKAVSC